MSGPALRIAITSTLFDRDARVILTDAGAEISVMDQQETTDSIEALLRDTDPHAVISRGVRLTGAAINAAPSLRLIAKTGVGVDNIDIPSATARGIPVLSNVGGNSISVAEHALGLMLALSRNIARHDADLRAGVWSRFQYKAHELNGKRLGLVGYGHSARHLATIARGLGMQISVHAPRYRLGAPTAPIHAAPSLPDLLATCDIISLHCPLTDATRGLINTAAIAAMKPGAWLINVSRGGVVDEDALVEGLRSGQIGAAGLDVHKNEPMPPTHSLFTLDNVVLTPHVAGSTIESNRRGHAQVARNVLAALRGQAFDTDIIVNHRELPQEGSWTASQ